MGLEHYKWGKGTFLLVFRVFLSVPQLLNAYTSKKQYMLSKCKAQEDCKIV